MKKLTYDEVVAIWNQRYGERKGNGIRVFKNTVLTVFLFHLLIIPYEIFINYGHNSDYLKSYLISFIFFFIIEGIVAIYIYKNYRRKKEWQVYLRIWLKGFMNIICVIYISLILFLLSLKIVCYEKLVKTEVIWFYFFSVLIWIFVPIILNLFSNKVIHFFILKERDNINVLRYFIILVPVFSGIGLLMSKYFGSENPDIRSIIVSIGLYLVGMLLYYFSLVGITIHINLLLYGIPHESILMHYDFENQKET